MKIKLISLLCVFIFLVTVMSAICFAEEYLPDEDGKYTVSLELEKNNEYILFVLLGVYDETNYIEAFNSCDDEDILYFEQKASDEDGTVTSGSFVPSSYADSTVLVGGTNYSEPIYAGILRANGATNVAQIKIKNILESYTVEGDSGEDIEISFEVELYDSYGYETITGEKAVLSLKESYSGVTLDSENYKIVIDKMAKAGTFTVVASFGEVTETYDVAIVRAQSEPVEIKLYTDEQMTAEKQQAEIIGVAGVFPQLEIFAKTFDQFGNVIEDTYTYKLNGTDYASSAFAPDEAGEYTFTVYSVKNPEVYASIAVKVTALYNLITECKEECMLLGTSKFVSAESGKDVYPEYKWTTQTKVDAFNEAIAKAQTGLDKFNAQEIADAGLASYISALNSAKTTYINTFKYGTKVDVTSISLSEQTLRISAEGAKVKLSAMVYPSNHTEKITWTSSKTSVATVDQNGYITPVSSGNTVITATTTGGMSATCAVTVYVPIRSLILSDSELNMSYGDTPYRLTIAATPKDHTDIVTWSSSNPSVATVSADGVVTPVWGGTAIITVSAGSGGEVSKTCKVTVTLPDWETAENPVSDVPSGKIFPETLVTLTTPTTGATIYYTLDGSVPTKDSRVYSNPIKLTKSCTLSAVAMGDNLFPSRVVSYEYEVVYPMLVAESVRTSAGETVEMLVSLENAPSLSELQIAVSYDEHLRLIGINAGSLDYTTDDGETNPRNITFALDSSDVSGVLVKLTFSAPIGTPDGSYEVSVEVVKAVDGENNDVEIEGAFAAVNVSDVILGDLNEDKEIDVKDVVLLAQYVAEWDSALESVDPSTTDVNADGETDMKDVVLLAQYVEEWDVELG